MPRLQLFRAAFVRPRSRFALAPRGGRWFGLGLVALGLGFLAIAMAPMLAGAQPASAAGRPTDPGVRGGAPGAGGPIDGLTDNQKVFFFDGQTAFNEVDAVANGLGPRFNMDSCGGCHAQPATGGTSPSPNPQVAVAKKNGATNDIPFFITLNGPVREARFPRDLATGKPDGGVHDLFTIAGRADAPAGCTSSRIPQPNFALQAANQNLIFRIPTPTFGAGLIQAITDETIVRNKESDGLLKAALRISGHENREGNAGTIARFGWKAQNKSLAIFAGEAYLVEQGVTNELFTQERGEPGDRGFDERVEPACVSNGTPEDHTQFDSATPHDTLADVTKFVQFMALSAQPQQVPLTPSAQNGQTLFSRVGCRLCHTPSLKTGTSSVTALSNKQANLFSDLLVHNMGTVLADHVSQGGAGPDEFRTAPLWGVGQRIFFLHDGRTNDLYRAIQLHASPRSEANLVIGIFNALSVSQQQDILNFLRSL